MTPKELQTGEGSGGVNINVGNGSMNVGGDIVGRDKTTYTEDSGQTQLAEILLQWQKQMSKEIDQANLSSDEKQDVKEQIDKIKSNIEQDRGKNPGRLEKLINMLSAMSPDIFDVATTTLVNPLAGIGLTIKKISDKAKLEVQPK